MVYYSDTNDRDSRRDLPDEPAVPRKKNKKKNRKMRVITVLLCIVLFFEALYCFLVFTDIPAIQRLRTQYISTALSTFSHQWLAEAFLPNYMVEEVRQGMQHMHNQQVGQNSNTSDRYTPSNQEDASSESTAPLDPDADAEEEAFYSLFHELNRSSFEAYVQEHPDVLDDGWENVYINEAGLTDEGTQIYTSMGEQVLAIDAKNQILLVRVTGTGYQGVLAVAKDPAQLRCEASAGIGSYGQSLGELVANNDGILGMTGSGFYDPNGVGTGGIIAGYAMCEGQGYGTPDTQTGSKRIELSTNNRLYICDTFDPVGSDVTDAVEFAPALIVDGKKVVEGFSQYDGIHPRAAFGQSKRGEVLMLVIEGRLVSRSMGTDVETVADILMRHDCYTALNLDGGTSAVMWFDGEYVTQCSNSEIQSRLLPNAWVYGNYE